ncbi:MAG: hypothetical protein RIE74_19970 [Pseudomonadales bacterium]
MLFLVMGLTGDAWALFRVAAFHGAFTPFHGAFTWAAVASLAHSYDGAAMEFVSGVREQIDPLFGAVIGLLESGGNPHPLAFFTLLRQRLQACCDEEDVLALFLDLSTTAFQGFVLSADQAAAVDRLLAACEQISLTMTADGAH